MAEEKVMNETPVADERKVSVAYTIMRYENGDVDVKHAGVEGTTELSSEGMYKDIEDVARIIQLKRIENASYAGVLRFYQQAQAAQDATDAE